ncbi:MAG TPA: VWA domain-containing protein [Verrucomicrobiae bacterium]
MKTNLENFDEAKLTAYALNELAATERSEVEKILAANTDARRWVEDVRRTALQLEKEFQGEECPALTAEQSRAIAKKIGDEKHATEKTSWWQWLPNFRLVEALAVVAVIAVMAAMLLPSLAKSKVKTRQLALNSQKQIEEKTARFAPAAVVAPPSPVAAMANPATRLPGLAAAQPASTPNRAAGESGFNLDAVKSAPAASDSALAYDTAAREKLAPQSAPVGLAMGGANSYASGTALGLEDGRQTQMRATKGISSVNGVSFQQGASALTTDGNISESFRSRIITSDNMSVDQLAVAKDEQESADAPLQNNFYRLVNSPQTGTATYPRLVENSFLTALNHPLSTFSIDVDTASYANVRRFLTAGQLPPSAAVRLEEMINYFHYNYPQPHGNDPFAANIEIAGCPWNAEHRLVRIGLKGREIAQDKRPPSNFVFLIDVSGSMQPPERLPLIKQALRQLVKKMTANDRVAIVIYAGAAGVKLESTSCTQKEKILEAIDELGAGGSTAGAAGIQAAYDVAQENFIKGGVNRVLLCTDGDFNVGITDQSQLVKIIQDKAKSGVFLTTLGVGTDNYKDALMQKLADKGNGNYAYLDTLEEAQKVLIDQMSGTLVTIAKDVKIQVEFNPAQVAAYRLIGYEKRMLRKEDFNNDKKDAGEIGAGHTVTALYEIVPAGGEIPAGNVDPLKYQPTADEKPERYVSDSSKELLTLKLRYKQPDGDTSKLLEFPVTDSGKSFARASTDFKFATAVAEFGMLLRGSEFAGNANYGSVLELAQAAKGTDAEGYRSEFLTLVKTAQRLEGQ